MHYPRYTSFNKLTETFQPVWLFSDYLTQMKPKTTRQKKMKPLWSKLWTQWSSSQHGTGEIQSAFSSLSLHLVLILEGKNTCILEIALTQSGSIWLCLWNHFRIILKQKDKKCPPSIVLEQISLSDIVTAWGQWEKYFYEQIIYQERWSIFLKLL